MSRLNLLGGQINLLGGQMPTQLTCYLPPCDRCMYNVHYHMFEWVSGILIARTLGYMTLAWTTFKRWAKSFTLWEKRTEPLTVIPNYVAKIVMFSIRINFQTVLAGTFNICMYNLIEHWNRLRNKCTTWQTMHNEYKGKIHNLISNCNVS